MKIIRLIRLIRLLKLFKGFQEKKRKGALNRILTINSLIKESNFTIERRRSKHSITEFQLEIQKNDKLREEKEKLLLKETRIGTKILENTVKRAILMVLILVFCAPLFNSSFYYYVPRGYVIDLKIMANFQQGNLDNSASNKLYEDYIQSKRNQIFPLIYCSIPSINTSFSSMDPSELRIQEKELYFLTISSGSANSENSSNSETFATSANSSNSANSANSANYSLSSDPLVFLSIIDVRASTQSNSIINILRTFYVAAVLLLASFLFNKDLHSYVIEPITRMIININKIANNPLTSKEVFIHSKTGVIYETELIEQSISKIGVLLALGFGEAGSFVISQNISNEGDLVATMPGKKTLAIFGFCDIRNFTDTTEILQEEVMVFVNSIAEVVHRFVDKYAGSANKNIGDAFLLVWKFPKSEILIENENLLLKKGRITKNIVDLALIAFIKIICAINKTPKFLEYRQHKGLNERIPNYQIKMGFGLHLGWAIEGSIGSEFKIDASYLSPNVNMAARLEAATKQYRSLLLMSSDFIEYSSKETRRFCREIDRVTVKGSIKPIGLFTIDIDLTNLEILKDIEENSKQNRKKSIRESKLIRENLMKITEKMNWKYDMDKDLICVLKNTKGEFKEKFAKGFMSYIDGDWKNANKIFEECLGMKEGDGPCMALMQVMEGEEWKAPGEWKGFRALTEK